MKDLLYGATVVDSKVFNVHGDHEQTYPWPECGFILDIPAGALDRTESCPVAVKALISGRFKFPKGFQLISALYAISPGRKFKKEIMMSIQHCFQIEREEQLKRLCFIKACGTANPSDPYVFEYVNGGTFTTGKPYCNLWQKEFSIYAAGIYTGEDRPNPERDGTGQQQNNEAEEGPAPDDNSQGQGEPNDEDPPPSEGDDTAIVNNNSGEDRQIGNEVDGASVPDTVTSDGKYSSTKYQAHFYFEPTPNRNSWNFKLVAIDDLAVHSKYINDKFANEEHVEGFMFQFLICPEPSIKFVLSEEKIRNLPPGWHVLLISNPCSIPKDEIDALSLKSCELRNQHPSEENIIEMIIPMIPIRKVSVFAENTCNHFCMDCGVAIEGIKPAKTINIVRQLMDQGNAVVRSPGPNPRGATGRQVNDDLNGITDSKKLKEVLVDQLNQNFDGFKNLFSGTIDSLAAKLFQNGMISGAIKSNPNFNTIWDEVVTSGFHFKRKAKDKIIDHCRKFLRIMSEIGVPQREAVNSVAEDMSDEVFTQFNVSIVFIG